MDPISPERLNEVEGLKTTIGWGWTEVSNRFGWGPPGLTKFRGLKAPIEERYLQYLRDVAHAVSSVPFPDALNSVEEPLPGDTVIVPASAFDEVGPKLRAAGFHPQADEPGTEVRVMLLDDIAAKIAAEYREIASHRMDEGEERGAKWMLSHLAERLGVMPAVKQLLTAPAQLQPPAPVSRMPDLPAPSNASGGHLVPGTQWAAPQPRRSIGEFDTF